MQKSGMEGRGSMEKEKKLPIGIENFEELRKEKFYYIDKTGLIRELIQNWSKVNLFTRPRRFGKSLNMSMLKSFFQLDCNKSAFDGLEISREKELCEEFMGKFPVVSISLKGVNAESYETACKMAVQLINGEARRFQYLLESEELSQSDKETFAELLKNNMEEAVLCYSLKVLSELLEKHHKSKVILLIDEYDVPLAKAFERGYYERMVIFIRNLLEQALKTNDSLKFAVLTGCMRISKESIFTGLNNLKVLSIADVRFDEYFGFTDQEVRKMLDYYGFSDKYEATKEWYDGYQFGNVNVYCPWDVINYCDILRADRDARPQNFWSNTSSNDAVRRFIEESANGSTKREIERLVAGEEIEKEIYQELTYKEMYQSIDNLWSVLFMTGYLTKRGRPDGKVFRLSIPNLEIREIFTGQIMEYFKERVQKDGEALEGFCKALKDGDLVEVERRLQAYLKQTISIRDTFVRKPMKENFYHGILLGLLSFKDSWGVYSNKETGDGYSDILVEIDEEDIGIIIEVKYAEDGNLEAGCQEALKQIEKNQYEEILLDEGVENILRYGMAFNRKRCRVMLLREKGKERTER